MTDTQTAFVLVPRDHGVTDDELYKAAISAAPKPPESEIGPVLWVSPGQFAAHRDPLDPDHPGGNYLPVRVTEVGKFTQPLYPQARIDADAAIIAALRAEVATLTREVDARGERLDSVEARSKLDQAIIGRFRAEVAQMVHDWFSFCSTIDVAPGTHVAVAATVLNRAEAAEARVKELEEVLIDVRSAADSFRDEDGDAVASQVISRARAALASKKETVDV